MKALATTVLLLTSAILSEAQTINPIAPRRGVYSIGFSIDWARAQDGGTESSYTVAPSYFVTDSLEVRAPFSFDDLLGNKETIYGIGFRWHFMKSAHSERKSVIDLFAGAEYAHASAGMGFHEDLIEGLAGFNYFVADNVAITTMLSIGQDRSNGQTSTTTNLTSGFTIFFSGK